MHLVRQDNDITLIRNKQEYRLRTEGAIPLADAAWALLASAWCLLGVLRQCCCQEQEPVADSDNEGVRGVETSSKGSGLGATILSSLFPSAPAVNDTKTHLSSFAQAPSLSEQSPVLLTTILTSLNSFRRTVSSVPTLKT